MTLEQVRKLYEATPFFSFTIHLADGRKFAVPSREFLFIPPEGRILVVVVENAVELIDLLLVTGLEIRTGQNSVPPDANGHSDA